MDDATAPVRHSVYRSINKPLLLLGVDRRLFFFAVSMGAAVFNLFNSVVGGLIILVVLYLFAQWATRTDPKILAILLKPLLNPEKYRPLQDPGKLRRSDLRLERNT
jgi:type IV secretory pathway TrbD component